MVSKEGVERGGTGERGTDPGGVVAASVRIEAGRGALGSQKGVKGDEREVCHARPGVEGRSSPGQGYPPPRGFHPPAARQRAIYHWFRPSSPSSHLFILLRRCRTPYFIYLVPLLLLLLLQAPSILILFSFVAPS